MKGKITRDGIFIEQLETDVGKYLPDVPESAVSNNVVKIDINQPMSQLRETLSKLPVTTRLSLTGTMVREPSFALPHQTCQSQWY